MQTVLRIKVLGALFRCRHGACAMDFGRRCAAPGSGGSAGQPRSSKRRYRAYVGSEEAIQRPESRAQFDDVTAGCGIRRGWLPACERE